METDLTTFQRNFRAMRAAADRGETVTVKSGETHYLFVRVSEKPTRPFADLAPFFGVVHRSPKSGARAHEKIRSRLKAHHSG